MAIEKVDELDRSAILAGKDPDAVTELKAELNSAARGKEL